MTIKTAGTMAFLASFALMGSAFSQDLGPQVRKLSDGVYVYVGKDFNSNTGIVLTQDGVVLIDSGHSPTDSRAVLEIVKKLNADIVQAVADPEFKQALLLRGFEAKSSTPEQLAEFMDKDYVKFRDLIQKLGLQVE